ncbi:MAG: U32 family peptidase [Candidatus Gastranaerophilales bacterium]|nr:U32 family peptidase [Candidatus Gastranaerophilales bacterium]
MRKNKSQIELLSPAKSLEAGIAAVKCGADAVYIGASRFGARVAAGNSLEDIEKLVKFAHKYRAKVYVTVNTILTDGETEEAARLIRELYAIGADAIIVQDMGLMELAQGRDDFPPIPLFASTQTDNRTPEKVMFLEEVGFKRVILARELSLEQIRAIRSRTNIDLEFFIHGALCVCYSGQCYMSYAIGGRSANRGECAQPCRRKYSLLDAKGKSVAKDKYLLSLKDLNLSSYLAELIDCGITSFKIEGRLKDEAYIKNVVSYYRRQLDNVLEGKGLHRPSVGKSIISFAPNLYKTFNRGYTDYFVTGKRGDIASINTPKSIGERVGRVKYVDRKFFTLDTDVKLNNGDGICFFNAIDELQGTPVNKTEGEKVFPDSMNGLNIGTEVFRNADHEFLKMLQNSKIERKIGLNLYLTEEDSELVFMAVDEEGMSAKISIPNTFESAKNTESALQTLEKQLLKLGDTDYYADNAEISLKTIPFIPVSPINEIRRKLIENLEIEREKAYTREEFKPVPNSFPYPEKRLDYKGNVLNRYAEAFYRRHGVEDIQPAAESGVDLRGKRVMTTKYCIRHQLGICAKNAQKQAYKEPLCLVDENGRRFELKFDCKKCEMNVCYTC